MDTRKQGYIYARDANIRLSQRQKKVTGHAILDGKQFGTEIVLKERTSKNIRKGQIYTSRPDYVQMVR